MKHLWRVKFSKQDKTMSKKRKYADVSGYTADQQKLARENQ